MNNLEKIQKTMKVFQTLTKIVMGFSFVAIAFTLVVGSVSLMADKLPFGELLQRLLIEADRTIDNREIGIALLCESVVLDGIVVGERAGRDDRIGEDLAVRAQKLGRAVHSLRNERAAPEIAVACG